MWFSRVFCPNAYVKLRLGWTRLFFPPHKYCVGLPFWWKRWDSHRLASIWRCVLENQWSFGQILREFLFAALQNNVTPNSFNVHVISSTRVPRSGVSCPKVVYGILIIRKRETIRSRYLTSSLLGKVMTLPECWSPRDRLPLWWKSTAPLRGVWFNMSW